MRLLAGRVAAQLLLPNGLIVMGAALLLRFRVVQAAIAPPTAEFGALAFLASALLLSWRFHVPRVGMMAVLLGMANWALVGAAAAHSASGHAVVNAVALLLPLNCAGLALLRDVDIGVESLAWWGVAVGAQGTAVAVLSRPELLSLLSWTDTLGGGYHLPALGVPPIALLVFAGAGLFLLLRAVLLRQPLDAAFFWSLGCCLLALAAHRRPMSAAYLGLAGLVMAESLVETSYLLAFHDELTGLPARRAFQRSTAKLAAPYTLAMVDIDHFKQFNDTFGHDVGDQVLRMVASRLERVTGGGQAFRLGGEEFAVLFRGRSPADVHYHAELLRQAVARTLFTVRGPGRSRRPREERRRHPSRRRPRAARSQVTVTISIGVAGTGAGKNEIAAVLRAADMALYQAKDRGRNRVELAPLRPYPAATRSLALPPDEPSSRSAFSAN